MVGSLRGCPPKEDKGARDRGTCGLALKTMLVSVQVAGQNGADEGARGRPPAQDEAANRGVHVCAIVWRALRPVARAAWPREAVLVVPALLLAQSPAGTCLS